MEVLEEAPTASAFIPLVEHQSTTPTSFYSGPPVLHYYSDRCKVLVLERDLSTLTALSTFIQRANPKHQSTGGAINGHGDTEETEEDAAGQEAVEEVDVWVTSDKLLLYSAISSVGLSISYQSIALHAIQSLPQPSPEEQQGVYMQIVSSPPALSGDEEPDSVSLTIIPTACAPPPAATVDDAAETQPEQTPVNAMFKALSDCSNLHPDPVDPGDDEEAQIGSSRLFQAGMLMPGAADGSLPPAMPGSGGWITAENMHDFVDEDGNWIADDPEAEDDDELGPGAGSVRPRDLDDAEGAAADGDETKWRRIS